jgi:hypothetical protein
MEWSWKLPDYANGEHEQNNVAERILLDRQENMRRNFEEGVSKIIPDLNTLMVFERFRIRQGNETFCLSPLPRLT